MSLRQLHIEGFGHFSGFSLAPHPGLNVVFGPNEAGKTTLAAFLRYVLFDHEQHRVANRAQALAGGRLGGRIELDAPGGLIRIERVDARNAVPTVRIGGQAPQTGDAAIRAALGGVDAPLFRAVFSFSLDDLSGLNALNDAGLRDRLFMGALAGAGRDVAQAITRLDQTWSTLFRPRSASEYTDAAERADTVRARLAEAQQALAALTRRQPEIERLRQALSRARDTERQATDAALRGRALLAAAPHHAALARASIQLERMPEGRSFTPAQRDALQSLDRELRDAEIAATLAESLVAARRAECAERAPPSPFGPFEHALTALDARLRECSPASRQAHEQAAGAARQRVGQGLRDLGLPDARALAALDLSVATATALQTAARAAEAQDHRLRAVEITAEEYTRRADALARREAERAALPTDAEALEAAAEVDALTREATAVEHQSARRAALEPVIEALQAEVQRAQSRLGPYERATDQPAERSRYATEIRAWRAEHVRLEARAAQWSAELETRQAALAALEADAAPPPADDAPLAALAGRVMAGVDAAVAADALASAARQRADAAALRAREAISALGAPFTLTALEALRSTPAAREVLRAAARGLVDTRAEAERAVALIAEAEAEAKRRDAPLEAPRYTLAELETREDALDAAESAVRARDEAALRAVQSPAATTAAPAWATPAGLVAGLCLMALGAVLLLQGSVGAGLVALVLGLLVALAAWRWLRPAPVSSPTGFTPPAEVMARAAAALAALGLPASAGAGALSTARAELRRERRRVEVQVRLAGAHQIAQARRAEAATAAQRWDTGLAEQAWPRPLAPEALDTTLAEVLQIRETLDAARREAEQAQEAAARFAAFCELTAPWAKALGRATPATAESARALAEGVRRSQEQAEDRARAARAHGDRLAAAQQALAHAAGELRGATEALAQSRHRADALDAQGERLGVPAGLGLDAAIGWLDDAAQAQSLAARLADHREQARQHTEAVTQWRRRVAEIAARLALPVGANTLALAQARCQQAADAAATVAEAEAECRRAQADLRAADEALSQARREAERDADAHDRWARDAARAGLPPNVRPEAIDTFLKTAERVSADARVAAEHEAALAQDAAAQVALHDEACRIADAVGEPAPDHATQVEAFVRRALTALTQDRVLAEETARLEDQRSRAEADHAAAHTRVETLRERLRLEWARLGVPDLATLERLAAEATAHAEVAAEARAHRNARDAALGPFAGHAEILATLDEATPGAWEVDAETAAREADAARAAADAATVEITRLETQFESAAFAREIPELQLDLEAARADAARARHAMVRVALAKHLLQRTLDRYREAHQPAILKTAGEYLAAATQGVYTGVETAARDGELVLVDAQGGRRESRHLSRGTTELLYLILRFGLAGQIGAGSPLPLVLDDVLVNLDTDRAAAVARLLAEVATRHQVLLLTCRAETRDLLLSTAADAHCVELPRFAGRSHPVSPAALQATLQQARDQGSVLTQGAARGSRHLPR